MTEAEKRDLAIAMCLTWRHDFLLQKDPQDPYQNGLTPEEQEGYIQRMLQLIEHHWPIEKINATAR